VVVEGDERTAAAKSLPQQSDNVDTLVELLLEFEKEILKARDGHQALA